MDNNYSSTGIANATYSDIIRDVTTGYLDGLTAGGQLPTLRGISTELVNRTAHAVDAHNRECPKTRRLPVPHRLSPTQIADAILKVRHVVRVCDNDSADGGDLLAVCQEEGPDKGTYVSTEEAFDQMSQEMDYTIGIKGKKEVRERLFQEAERATPCSDPDLVAVNNGIFDYKNKTLLPFSPGHVFLSKSRVDYVENPANPAITNPDGTVWDVESWMAGLSDDPEIVGLLWEIMGAVIRPNVRWDKSAWFCSSSGCNGKGTLCELMRGLCGNSASIKLSDFSRDFMMSSLVHASAIITDENDTGETIDRAGNLKTVITNDMLQINRKFRDPIDFRFRGFMVQCINSMPKVKDCSGSFYRRLLLVPFGKCFSGAPRKYIKDDYVKRKEVLEYVLHKVMNMDCYSLSEPAACRKALADYRELNEPVREFWNEFRNEFTWDVLPYPFLYELYKAWSRKYNPSGCLMDNKAFIRELKAFVEADGWEVMASPVRPGNRINRPESLIAEYRLKEWDGGGSVPPLDKRKKNCKGLCRKVMAAGVVA